MNNLTNYLSLMNVLSTAYRNVANDDKYFVFSLKFFMKKQKEKI